MITQQRRSHPQPGDRQSVGIATVHQSVPLKRPRCECLENPMVSDWLMEGLSWPFVYLVEAQGRGPIRQNEAPLPPNHG